MVMAYFAKKVCVCAGGWGGVLNVMLKRVKKKTPRQTTITVLGLLGVIVNPKLQHHITKRENHLMKKIK